MEKLKLGTRFDGEKFQWDEGYESEDIEDGISRETLTVREVNKAMNSINEDVQFTTEVETDFENRRLPTLSFELWSESDCIRHSYFEKPMRSQVLTMSQSSMSEHSKFSILTNELRRRFEVMDECISIEEKISIVNHFTKQLINSGYTHNQAKDIIVSSLVGIKRREKKRSGEKR